MNGNGRSKLMRIEKVQASDTIAIGSAFAGLYSIANHFAGNARSMEG